MLPIVHNNFISHSYSASLKPFTDLWLKGIVNVTPSKQFQSALVGRFSKIVNIRYDNFHIMIIIMKCCVDTPYLQVVTAAKYIVRKESTRDHVDLLMSSKYWPVVFAVDMACDLAAHIGVRNPSLSSALWGRRQGCFETPNATHDPDVRFMSVIYILLHGLYLHVGCISLAVGS